jgi:hypothetical protein
MSRHRLLARGARDTSLLGSAVMRSGRTTGEIAFLAGLDEARLRHLMAGVRPSPQERDSLRDALPDWRPAFMFQSRRES